MAFSSGTALMFAARLSKAAVLWGPFQFREAAPDTEKTYWIKSLGQTVFMWLVFLAIFPVGIASIETIFGLNRNWFDLAWLDILAGLLFIAGGSFGIWAGRAMTFEGKGTPLPSQGAKALVLTGPYRFVRNPMAIGGILQGAAVGIVIGSPLVILYSLLGGIAWNTLVRPLEEEYLEGIFGEEYLAYLEEVRCWLP